MASQPNSSAKKKEEKGKNIQVVVRCRYGKPGGIRSADPSLAAGLPLALWEERDFVYNC